MLPHDKRVARIGKEFSQDFEIYQIVTSEIPGMPTYVELATICNTEDLHNCLEIIAVKQEYEELARLQSAQTQNQ